MNRPTRSAADRAHRSPGRPHAVGTRQTQFKALNCCCPRRQRCTTEDRAGPQRPSWHALLVAVRRVATRPSRSRPHDPAFLPPTGLLPRQQRDSVGLYLQLLGDRVGVLSKQRAHGPAAMR
jgi:hypothetical protein